MLSTRTQLQISVGAALLGILLVAAFAWQALERASQQATSVGDPGSEQEGYGPP